MASWFPSGVAAPASPPPPRGCNPSRLGASPSSSRACGPRSPRARSPHSKSAGAMARGACVPWASSGARAQAGWWGAVLGALCLLPALLLLVRLGAPPAAWPAASAAQVSPSRRQGQRTRPSVRASTVPSGWGWGQHPSSPAHAEPRVFIPFSFRAVKALGLQTGSAPPPPAPRLFLPFWSRAALAASSEHSLPLKEDAATHPAGVLSTPGPGPLPAQAPRRRRYTLTPARLRWDHFNLTYRCDPGLGAGGCGSSLAATPDRDPHPRILSFPRNLLSPSETRRGLAAAFRMWSDVSPFSFREVAPEQPSDLRIGERRAPAPRPAPAPPQPCAPQASTRPTTRTAWCPRCTTASTAPRASWPTPSSPRTAASTSTTASTGSWAPRATAGRKVTAGGPLGDPRALGSRWRAGGRAAIWGEAGREGAAEATGLSSRSSAPLIPTPSGAAFLG